LQDADWRKPWASYEQLRDEAVLLAGGINDLAQRASVYHHLFEHSRGNHVFPLLAAHGALWAGGYFRLGMKVGSVLTWRYALAPATRRDLMARLTAFANAFRDINRRVCIETYTIYYISDQTELLPFAERHVPPDLLEQMARCHAARRAGRQLSDAEKRSLFGAFFLWEQNNIVGPSVDAAAEEFTWLLMKRLALRPTVRFSYLPKSVSLPFRNFADMGERIERGFQAFDAGALVGWGHVEEMIDKYQLMPEAFFENSSALFFNIRNSLLSAIPNGPTSPEILLK
jgi:hypothetical protein